MTRGLLLSMFILISLAGCNKNKDVAGNAAGAVSNEQIIAGTTEKSWKATRETNTEGDTDKLTKAEKEQTITFWRNGNVKMGDGQQTLTGQWTYSGSVLTMQFTGDNVTENFTVVELDEDKMLLRAADGSELTMKPI